MNLPLEIRIINPIANLCMVRTCEKSYVSYKVKRLATHPNYIHLNNGSWSI